MIRLNPNRNFEWPITHFWYTKKKNQTIEHIIDTDVSFFEWAVSNFQNVTPEQAKYYYWKTGRKIDPRVIQDVEPYNHDKNDPDEMYMELCRCQDLDKVIKKYRVIQLELF